MRWLLLLASVVFGYIFSQTLNGLFVYYFYIGKRSDSIPALSLITVLYFVLVGLLTGLIVALISRRFKALASYIVAGLIIVVTILNIALDVAAEPLSHKLIVIVVLSLAVLLGARFVKPSSDDGMELDRSKDLDD